MPCGVATCATATGTVITDGADGADRADSGLDLDGRSGNSHAAFPHDGVGGDMLSLAFCFASFIWFLIS